MGEWRLLESRKGSEGVIRTESTKTKTLDKAVFESAVILSASLEKYIQNGKLLMAHGKIHFASSRLVYLSLYWQISSLPRLYPSDTVNSRLTRKYI